MLEANTADELLRLAHTYLARELEIMQLRSKIATEAQTEMDKSQRDYVLRQQMKAIQKELGEDEGGEQAEAALLRERLEKADLPEEVRTEAERELKRMERLPASRARLSRHSHLSRIRSRVAVAKVVRRKARSRTKRARFSTKITTGSKTSRSAFSSFWPSSNCGRIRRARSCCFVGPPGVGKTSLGRSIARALGRQFERMSLGGMRDEAELRGHRRTYIGAMPGRIIQSMRRAGVNNPVLMLDEIDKLGNDYRGDPASALLEILDPQQNNTFRDHYLDLPFDLSKVFFIATANQLGPIPPPLRDRMEIISLAGYSDREKLEIAKRYLVPRQIKENGLKPEQLKITDDCDRIDRRALHARSRRAPAGTQHRQRGAQGRAEDCAGAKRKAVTVDAEDITRLSRRAAVSIRSRRAKNCRPASRPEWRGRRWAARCCSSKRRCFPAAAA